MEPFFKNKRDVGIRFLSPAENNDCCDFTKGPTTSQHFSVFILAVQT